MAVLDDYVLTIAADTRRFEAAMRRAAVMAHKLGAAWLYHGVERKHRRRCAICNPAGFPAPLKVNGADYQRRRNNRRKRT